MNNDTYIIEEILLVLAELTGKYTSGESSSVTYEKAQQLMGAILYCIRGCGQNHVPSSKRLSARQAYLAGYEIVLQKVKKTRENYNEMISSFCSYGNKNYDDTVTKAVAGFFLYYDARFAPQETLITMDYPTLRNVGTRTGIDAVEDYVKWISLEQEFMGQMPESYVCDILRRFQRSYQKQFYNICRIVLRHILGCMLIRKTTGEEPEPDDYQNLKKMIQECSKDQLKDLFAGSIDGMIREKWKDNQELGDYLKADIDDFVPELLMACENNCLERVVVL